MSLKANAPASALFVAALALISDYAALSEQRTSDPSPVAYASESPAVLKLRSVIAALASGWNDLDTHYARSVEKIATLTSIDEEHFLRNMELLKATRQLEEVLRDSPVPSALSNEHEQLRRSVAKVRTRLATMDVMYRQFFVRPDEFPSQIERQALRDLADHTTKRIAKIA
ncbi:hypothetical protein V0R50_06625 [Pseudomonas sp. 148P]|uniref:Uncharacterized protein n=1 Tax=Pseudomonas ulcerans TaxID=3115852 RepID=A0ABU7HMX3_9PSED|nr:MULTISPECIES: hypothetical protein [unclassified Pseudomonas]MEE1922414.1 hypothetical protein [Pseudomonas sp. 147P]MEE1932888.1 hypothetical protein [Pseudomonas sp. 148P]